MALRARPTGWRGATRADRCSSKAAAGNSVAAMIAADLKLHDFIYGPSANPLIAPTMEAHSTSTQRVMGEVLMRDELPRDIWDQHEAMFDAVMAGDGAPWSGQG